MENVFYTADEHLGHSNVILFCKRPFASIEEMTEGLIERHNSVVRKGDLVYHCGDIFWKTFGVEQAKEYIDRLNGNHYLIWGNHDELVRKNRSVSEKFVWRKDIANTKPFGTKLSPVTPNVVLCHYAMRVWEGSHRGSWQLFGHSHGKLPVLPVIPEFLDSFDSLYSMDVGVDTHNWYPWSIEEVAQEMAFRRSLVNKPMNPVKELRELRGRTRIEEYINVSNVSQEVGC